MRRLWQLVEQETISIFAGQFAAAMSRIAPAIDEDVALLLALLAERIREGHVCIDVGKPGYDTLTDADDNLVGLGLPVGATMLEKLAMSALASTLDRYAPLVVDGSRVYLRRYAQYEQELAQRLMALAATSGPSAAMADANWDGDLAALNHKQKLAVTHAMQNRLTVIAGGPGTGKTYSVAALMLNLCRHASAGSLPKFMLLAPTGKAAKRLETSIVNSLAKFQGLDETLRVHLHRTASEAKTIHRALGMHRWSTGKMRHDAQRPLPADVVIVDECSMVDLAVMLYILRALPADGRLILLGDPQQLVSVGVGTVLGDICLPAAAGSCVGERIVVLDESRRFAAERGIGRLAQALERYDEQDERSEAAFWQALQDDPQDVLWRELKGDGNERAASWLDELKADILTGYAEYRGAKDDAAALAAFERFRVLCALRHGPFGVETLNRTIADWADDEAGDVGRARRPILVMRNDYDLDVFNGDIGTTVKGRHADVVFSKSGDIQDLRRMSLGELPAYELAYAMTVHKSQGSEYDRVLVVLPPAREGRAHPLVTRELLYTAVTRAKSGVTIVADKITLRAALTTPVQRASGLTERLRQTPPNP